MRTLFRACPLLAALLALAGCASVELAKGDVIRIEKRTLPAAESGFRLRPAGRGRLALKRVGLCPAQERRVYREVEVRRVSGAVAGAEGVGCTLEQIGEVSRALAGQRPRDPGNCLGVGGNERRPTGRTITEAWRTVRKTPCGAGEAVPAGGQVRVTFLRSRETRAYTLGEGGTLRLPEEDLIRLRLYLTVLKKVEVEVGHAGKTWRQTIDLE